jgi:hypothetical protein
MIVVPISKEVELEDRNKPDETVVFICKALLTRAEKGDIRAIAVSTVSQDFETDRYQHTQTYLQLKIIMGCLMGQLHCLAAALERNVEVLPMDGGET